jgi:hypothetical protein
MAANKNYSFILQLFYCAKKNNTVREKVTKRELSFYENVVRTKFFLPETSQLHPNPF